MKDLSESKVNHNDAEVFQVDSDTHEKLYHHLNSVNQVHLLDFWSSLSDEHKQSLYNDIFVLDVKGACASFRSTIDDVSLSSKAVNGTNGDDRVTIEPLSPDTKGSASKYSPHALTRLYNLGLSAIATGQVGVILLAGGQGTRIGVKYPKGMYDVGLPSGKSLFQLQAERILRLERLAWSDFPSDDVTEGMNTVPHPHITWYIMTSESTCHTTKQFFREHNYFGLVARQVVFFEQSAMPCFSTDGRVILEAPHRVSRAPDGNGGLYRALQQNRLLDDMRSRGLRHLHVYCVDNILVKVADPVFIGFCLDRDVECAAKVVEKTQPCESVGVICYVDGHHQVVEYSEISPQLAAHRQPDGSLTYSAGSICNHYFSIEFLHRVTRDDEHMLKYHVANKKIPFIDESGETQMPSKANGIKLEKFVFDVFPFARSFAVWEVERGEEFSPLKNADGAAKDTPTTAREALCSLHLKYLQQAGCSVAFPPSSESHLCEISPLVSYGGEGLERFASAALSAPIHIEEN